jgi:hypothetical protein
MAIEDEIEDLTMAWESEDMALKGEPEDGTGC